jgi:hypothetical protein
VWLLPWDNPQKQISQEKVTMNEIRHKKKEKGKKRIYQIYGVRELTIINRDLKKVPEGIERQPLRIFSAFVVRYFQSHFLS